ncbi:MAG: S-layer homology domain-containing protein [Acidimicrobiales bacterium]
MAAALALAALPLTAAGAEEGTKGLAESPLEVQIDRPLVMLGDEIEVEIEYELEVEEPTEAEEGEVAAAEGDEGAATDPAPAEPVGVTFTVDLGDGTDVITEVVDNENDGSGIEAQLRVTHTYGALGTFDVVVTATPDGGDTVTTTSSVEVTDQPVAHPRPGRHACPDDDDATGQDPATEDPAPEEVAAASRPDWTPPARATDFFTDVADGSTHGHFISCLARAGLVSGVAPGQFAPGRSVSREQLATLLVRAIERSGAELPAGDDSFSDDDGSVHEDSINALAAAGLVSGTADGTFGPKAPVTRAQMATFLTSVYERIAEQRLTSAHDYFGDDDSSVHEDSINRAAAAGFAAGTERAAFAPGLEVSRAQIATFLARMLDRLAEEATTTA